MPECFALSLKLKGATVGSASSERLGSVGFVSFLDVETGGRAIDLTFGQGDASLLVYRCHGIFLIVLARAGVIYGGLFEGLSSSKTEATEEVRLASAGILNSMSASAYIACLFLSKFVTSA